MALLLDVAEFAEAAEVGPGGLGVFAPGWDGHEADGHDVFEWSDGVEEGWKVVRGDAVLRIFVGEFDFDVDRKLFVEGCCGGIEALCEFYGVDGVYGVKKFGGARGLVRLQGADEVVLGILQMSEG